MPKVRVQKVKALDVGRKESDPRWLMFTEDDACRPVLCLTEREMEELIDSILTQQQQERYNALHYNRRVTDRHDGS
jgi:hypothetical protein